MQSVDAHRVDAHRVDALFSQSIPHGTKYCFKAFDHCRTHV